MLDQLQDFLISNKIHYWINCENDFAKVTLPLHGLLVIVHPGIDYLEVIKIGIEWKKEMLSINELMDRLKGQAT